MRALKRENRGFSLIELIVVVLILGILAVSVAPQIMKWVGKSEIAADRDNANELKFIVQTALADWQSRGGKISTTNDFTLSIKQDGTLGSCTDWNDGTATESFKGVIDETVSGGYPQAKYDVLPGDIGFEITVERGTGKITVKCKAQSVTL